MPKKTFTKDFMLSVLEGDVEGAETVENGICDTTRWCVVHDLTFAFEGDFWHTCYRVGSTEQQDESPWECEDEIECTQVEPVEKTVTVYEPVKD